MRSQAIVSGVCEPDLSRLTAATAAAAPTYAAAEQYLLALTRFGMRFGLDRMRLLLNALGQPERRFDTIQVLGTNGKSSTSWMIGTLLAAHGRTVGVYTSPHLFSFTERVRIGRRTAAGTVVEAAISEADFAAALSTVAEAAATVEASLGPDDHLTQFEILTATALTAFANAQVDVAVIEAGLGGRYDATTVVPARVQVLTNVDLEHTQWLGSTARAIAAEKLAALRAGATLVVGKLQQALRAQVLAAAADVGAHCVEVERPLTARPLAVKGAFQQANFALARQAAAVYLGELDERAVAAAAQGLQITGRCQVLAQRPLTIVDGAHNPAGVAALLPALLAEGRQPLIAVVSILADKDAATVLRLLLQHCREVILTGNHSPRALAPASLAALIDEGTDPARVQVEPDPHRALALARARAGSEGLVAVTGSLCLVADLLQSQVDRGDLDLDLVH